MDLKYNEIGVLESNVCINSNDFYCLEYANSKIITIEFFNLIVLLFIPVILINLFVSIFKRRR